MNDTTSIETQLKELERDKRMEEIKQLKSASKIRWITPAAIASLLPLFAGLFVWTLGEIKQYNEGYRALAELESIKKEKQALIQQKDSLNIELGTLIQLKNHYVTESNKLRIETATKQDALDKTYLRGKFTSEEIIYALGHVKGLGPPPKDISNRIRKDTIDIPKETQELIEDMIVRYELSQEIIDISGGLVTEFEETFKLMSPSDWTKGFKSMPTGYYSAEKKIMISELRNKKRYYDVTEGRILRDDEAVKFK